MRELLIRLAGMGKTLLVTSHILPELSVICDRVAILTHGKLRAYGTVNEIGRQVSQQRTIEVQLAGAESIPAAADIVRQMLDGAEVTESPPESAIRFRTDRTEEELGQILAELVGAAIPVTQFRELQTDLEEAFMSFARPGDASGQRSSVASAEVV
jgi:ABC-2 type transport system ATP-binding protein